MQTVRKSDKKAGDPLTARKVRETKFERRQRVEQLDQEDREELAALGVRIKGE